MAKMVREICVQVRKKVGESQGTFFQVFGGNPGNMICIVMMGSSDTHVRVRCWSLGSKQRRLKQQAGYPSVEASLQK